jgi:hypothetical protein
MTLVVGSCSDVSEGLRVGLSLLWSRSCSCGWTCGDDALWRAVWLWWLSSARVLHILSSELNVRIGAASLLCEDSPVWHSRRGLHEAVMARSSLMVVLGEVGVAGSWRSDDDDADRQPRWRISFAVVCVWFVFGSLGDCVPSSTVMFHDGRFVSVFGWVSVN